MRHSWALLAGALEVDASQGESRYVGYEMWLRGLETRCGGIIGASGCFYASRRELHDLFKDVDNAILKARHHRK